MPENLSNLQIAVICIVLGLGIAWYYTICLENPSMIRRCPPGYHEEYTYIGSGGIGTICSPPGRR